MMPLCRLAFLAALTITPDAALANPTFTDVPISCGGLIQFKGCTAAFDGQTLRLTYTPPDGKPSHAVYKHCTSTPIIIHCPEGRWQSENGTIPLGARSIGLRDNKPYPD